MRHTTTRVRRTMSALLVAGTLTATAGCGGGDAAEPVAEAGQEPAAADPAADDGTGTDQTGTDETSTDAPAYGLVDAETAAGIAAQAGVMVIDVRTPEEYAEGHIEGAQLIDFYGDTFADQIAALDPDGEYLVYCRSGNRSGQAVGLMQQLGFEQVYDLDGGVVAYAQAGLPLVR